LNEPCQIYGLGRECRGAGILKPGLRKYGNAGIPRRLFLVRWRNINGGGGKENIAKY
jgi:hypothetical protein